MKGKNWKRNMVAAVVVAFLCAGVYLNWSYSRPDPAETAEAGTETELAETLNAELLEETARDPALSDTGAAEEPPTVDAMTEDVVVLDEDVWNAVLTEADTDTTMQEYFAAIRLARQESRDSAVDLLQETIAYETGEDESAVSAASEQISDLVSLALKEAEIEGLVIAKGFEDCVAYMTDGAVSVAVAAPEEGLSQESVARICDIVTTQTDYTPSQLKIIEVR